jgi:subtilisin family serine protease
MKSQIHTPVRILIIVLFLYVNGVNAQLSPASVNSENSKVLSGKLLEKINNIQRLSSSKLKSSALTESRVFLYFAEYPSADQIKLLESYGVKLMWETWTPPVENHPLGFIAAAIPDNNLQKVISVSSLKKIDTAERNVHAMNNTASQMVGASMVWDTGFTGKGVKVGILDSGIDTTYAGTDLPATFQKKDYSYYPLLDNNVSNTVTGHGTHVAGTVLGRGVLSQGQSHSDNGRGAFKGMAPAADLVFLKIGQDEDAVAEDPPLIAAIDAAVNIYHVNVISLSYGGWDDFHDGSGPLDQKVDWAYSKGVPFFCSAGNAGNDQKHWMGTVAANSQSEMIEVKVTAPNLDTTMLRFNMVWADGVKRNDLTIKYFDATKAPLTDVTILPVTQSLRGTESRYSWYNPSLKAAGTYYLQVVNNSAESQVVHIYEDWNNLRIGTDHVYFSSPQSAYTIGSPSSADHAMSVGAYVTRNGWMSSGGSARWWGLAYVENMIADFSSRGPTLDGRIKPDITAPGHVLISLRDQKVYTTPGNSWIDNDGVSGGNANYYQMRGTSMACPVAAGAAALFLEKYPSATPQQVYDAMKNYSNQAGLTNLPDNTYGAGRLNVLSAMNGYRDAIVIDGNINDGKYNYLAKFTSNRNGMGDKNNLGELKYFSDGKNLYIGITGEVTADNNILLFMDFSGVQGRGTNTLGGGTSDFVNSAFSYMGNVKMDFDVDFALGFNKGNSGQFEFFGDAIRYGATNKIINIGRTNQMGGNSSFEIGSVFGGSGCLTFAYDSAFAANKNKGVEMKIPLSAFAGVDTSQTLRFFVVLSPQNGKVSNECIPGDPGAANPGDGANFSVIPNQDFFTGAVKISGPKATTLVLTNEGGLIDKLIAEGYGNSNLYQILQLIQSSSGHVVSNEFMATLAALPAGREIFTVKLSNFAGLNNPVSINSDGTLGIQPAFGKDYYKKNGFSTYPETETGTEKEMFTYAKSSQFYIDAGARTTTDRYYAMAIAWAKADTLSVSYGNLNVAAANGSTANFTVTSNTKWTVISGQEWLTVGAASGSGKATLTVTAAANPVAVSRNATVTVSATGLTAKTITFTQAAAPATLTVNSTALNMGYAAGSTATFTVTSNADWTINTGQSWLTANPATGTGNKSINLTAQANTLPNNRIATVTVSAAGTTPQTIQVTQSINTAIQAADAKQLLVYPNPFMDGIHVQGINTRAVLSLSDITGRVLLEKDLKGDGVLGTASVPAGMYILKVVTENFTLKQKLIKK